MIILPTAHAPALDPDDALEQVKSGQLTVDAPLCQRCGVKASPENPVGVTFRPSWNPYASDQHRHMDAICARCREELAAR